MSYTKLDLTDMECKGEDCIQLAQNRVRVVLSSWVLENNKEILIR